VDIAAIATPQAARAGRYSLGRADTTDVPDPAAPGPRAVTREAVAVAGFDAVLLVPTGIAPAPAVVLATGCQLDGSALEGYGQHLASHGIAVLIPTFGDSLFAPISHSELADDFVAMIAWLSADAGIDPTRIGAAGHSRGGKIAIVATTRSTAIKALFGLDSVDSAGGPCAQPSPSNPSVTPELMAAVTVPFAVLGSAYGGTAASAVAPACAPVADNYHQYALAAAAAPVVYEWLAPASGHNDFADPPRAHAAAGHDVAVLVLGETGSGKEGIARLVHEASARRGPFIAVNCAALGGDTATAALFGHERGAFTGATGARKGFFAEAEHGTLFLDEIGELSPDAQPRLLRALEQKEIVPVGASRPSHIDVRIVAATNADLGAKIKAGQFRADLHARLAVWIVEVPPLARRRDDVLRLARHFAGRSPRGRSAFDETPLFEVELAERLVLHGWPYTVRELRQLVLALRVAGIPPWGLEPLPAGFGEAVGQGTEPALEDTVPQQTRRTRTAARPERDELLRALESQAFNVSAVARMFGRDRKQI